MVLVAAHHNWKHDIAHTHMLTRGGYLRVFHFSKNFNFSRLHLNTSSLLNFGLNARFLVFVHAFRKSGLNWNEMNETIPLRHLVHTKRKWIINENHTKDVEQTRERERDYSSTFSPVGTSQHGGWSTISMISLQLLTLNNSCIPTERRCCSFWWTHIHLVSLHIPGSQCSPPLALALTEMLCY